MGKTHCELIRAHVRVCAPMLSSGQQNTCILICGQIVTDGRLEPVWSDHKIRVEHISVWGRLWDQLTMGNKRDWNGFEVNGEFYFTQD